jgi:hypothetical protein
MEWKDLFPPQSQHLIPFWPVPIRIVKMSQVTDKFTTRQMLTYSGLLTLGIGEAFDSEEFYAKVNLEPELQLKSFEIIQKALDSTFKRFKIQLRCTGATALHDGLYVKIEKIEKIPENVH